MWILGIGALLAALSAMALGSSAIWNGLGTLYLGLPALALVAMRTTGRVGLAGCLVVFVAIWAADTGALVGGRLLKGPKLAPSLSPNKTWSGFLVGTLASAVGAGIYIGVAGGQPAKGAAFGERHQERWGLTIRVEVPGANHMLLYQPQHPTAYDA